MTVQSELRPAAPFSYAPFSPEHRADPYPVYRRLRDEAPVLWAPDPGCWCISRYDDVLGVLNDPETFSSEAMFSMLMNAGQQEAPPMSWNLARFIFKMIFRVGLRPSKFANVRSLIAEDGARHSETRGLVNRGFTPRRIADLEPRIRELTEEILEPLREGRSFDLVRDFSVPLPVTVIAELLGIEKERHADFKRWSDKIVEGSTTTEGRERRNRADPDFADTLVEIFGYLKRIGRERRKRPAGDVISAIVADHEGKAGLNEYDVVAFVVVLLVAGNETTTNLIGNCVRALLDHPDQLLQLQQRPDLVAPALEEALRYDSPIQLLFRTATRDVEMHGVTIREGDTVMPLLGSANRDERHFADPDRFDIERNPRGHVAFGFGKHFCLGASLARLEARCALEAILPELSRWVPDDAPQRFIDSFLVRGPAALPFRPVA